MQHLQYVTYECFVLQNCKYWVELHRETSKNPRELRLFQPKEKADDKAMKHDQSITLHNVLEVCDKEQNISERPVFQIIFTKCEHQFLAESTEEMERWIVVLQQEIFGLPIQGVTCMSACVYFVQMHVCMYA